MQEVTNSLVIVDLNTRRVASTASFSHDQLRHNCEAFPRPSRQQRIGRDPVNADNGHVFVVKEGRPGLLIELDPSLTTILSAKELKADMGFTHPKLKPGKLDFSGLSYDSKRHTIWIASDKGQCLFHFDWERDAVLERLDLTISTGGKDKQVRKAEGVAIDPDRNRVYVVSDRDAELYVFKLHDDS